MFSLLTDKLEDAFKKLRGLGRISESNITDAMKDIRLALLEADVDFQVTKDLLEAVKTAAMGEEVLRSVSPGQQIVKIFNDELVKILGGGSSAMSHEPPQRILMDPRNGAGKTTTSAKLANWLKKQGKRPVLIALDLYRPAAIKQLQVLGDSLNTPVWAPAPGETDPVRAAKASLEWLAQQGSAVAIFDTAGRQDLDSSLIDELKKVASLVQPSETLLVADAATGQQAVFHPDRMAQRILGMGDVVSLVEKAAEEIDEKEALRMAKRFEEAKFDFNDFLSQMRFMKKLGPLEGILGMIPGMSKMKELGGAVNDKRMKHVEAMVLSMTPAERSKPDLLNGSRRKRIANGSGRPVMEVNQLIKQFDMMRGLMKNKGAMAQLAGGLFGGGAPGGGKMPPGMGGMPGLGGMPGFPGMKGGRPKLGGSKFKRPRLGG